MEAIWQFITAHQTSAALIAFWLASNFVSSLPSPNNSSVGFYKWFFAFLHGLSGSLPRVFPGARIFNDPTRDSGTYFQKADNPASQPPSGGGGQP